MNRLRVALLGFGVVGSGVYDMLKNPPYNAWVTIECIFVRHIGKNRGNVDMRLFTDRIDDVFEHKAIDVIIEAMGGVEPAKTIITRAIRHKIHVITANKEVVDHDFHAFVSQARKRNVAFLFEASVVAGVPTISSLVELADSDRITSIEGILNGATNDVLTHVESGLTFSEATRKARQQGFLEADPKDDFEGFDAIRKIKIMARIAFKTSIPEEHIERHGLKDISRSTIEFITARGWCLKQVAQAEHDEQGVRISVEPMIVSGTSLLGSVKHEENIVIFHGNQRGRLVMMGKGAGKKTTAAAMVNDLMLIGRKRHYTVEEQPKTHSSLQHLQQRPASYLLEVSDHKPFESIALIESDAYIITKPIGREVIEILEKDIRFYARIHEKVRV